MQVALLFPPFSTVSGTPPAALSALSASLRAAGAEVLCADLNAEFFLHFLSRRTEFEDAVLHRWADTQPAGSPRVSRMSNLTLPLLRILAERPTSKLLQEIVREVSAELFAPGLFDPSGRLTATLQQVSTVIDKVLDSAELDEFLGQRFDWSHVDIVGLSLISETQFPYALLFCRWLKREFPNVKAVMGGAYVTEVFSQLIAGGDIFDDFDYLVTYEGESAFDKILHQNDAHPNIASRRRQNVVAGPFLVEDLEQLPAQTFAPLRLDVYRPWGLTLPLYSSKGCSWGRCAFCSQNQLRKYREKSMGSFVRGLVAVEQETGASRFQIVDEDLPPQRLEMLADLLLESPSESRRWSAQTRFYPRLDKSLLAKLRASGCESLEFGLESGSPYVLKIIRKGIALPLARRTLAACEDAGIPAIVNCMIGFPGETEDDVQQTLAFVDSTSKAYPRLSVRCNTQTVKIYRNSPFGRFPELYGVQDPDPSPLSVTVRWKHPAWVSDFLERHRKHLLLNEQTRPGDEPAAAAFALPPDPRVALSSNWVCLEASDRFGSGSIVELSSGQCRRFALNTTMRTVVDLLAGKGRPLSVLKQDFSAQYSGFPTASSSATLGGALMRLNEIGALEFNAN